MMERGDEKLVGQLLAVDFVAQGSPKVTRPGG
jgi:hypothetical protein